MKMAKFYDEGPAGYAAYHSLIRALCQRRHPWGRRPDAVKVSEIARLLNVSRQLARYGGRCRGQFPVGLTQTMVDCTSPLSHAMPLGVDRASD
jgi:hypothetical protein